MPPFELLVFYGSQVEREELERNCPEIHDMYFFLHLISKRGPRAQVGDLVGKGWDDIYYKFG